MAAINKHDQLWESLTDPEFRKQIIDEHINVGLAFQIRGLRIRQKLTQTKLAELLGDERKQPLISEWENPNYGKYTLATLKELAKAFDVGLLVRFVPFSKLVDWTVDLTNEVIAPPSFTEEQPHVATVSNSPASFLKDTSIHADKVIFGVFDSGTTVDGLLNCPRIPESKTYPYESSVERGMKDVEQRIPAAAG